MAGWIDIMGTDSEKPSVEGFNYATEQDKLKRRRTAAQLLKDQALKDQQGQYMKHGDFVGFSGGNTLASTAGRILSAYLGTKSDKGADAYASEIDKTSDAAFMEQANKLDALLNPKAATETPSSTGSMQGAETVSQQPVTPTAEPAQSFPVREPSVESRPLPPAAPSAPTDAGAGRGFVVEAPGARAAAAAMPPANGGQRRGGTVAEMRRNAYVAGGDQPVPPFQGAGATGSWDAPAPTPPTPPAAAPKMAAQAMNPTPAAPQAPAATQQPTGLMPDMTPRAAPPAPPAAPAAPKVSQSEVLSQLHSIAKTGPMGQQFASAQLQQMFGPKANGYEFKDVNGKLVAVNPRNPKDAMVVFDGGAKPEVAAAAKKDRREEVKLWGEQRRTVGEAKERLDGAGSAITRLQDGITLAKDVNIRGLFSSGWEQVKGAVKENPKLRNLEMLDSELLLDAATALKGAMSDKDLEFIRQGAPNKTSTVDERLIWAERVLPRLQAAQARAQKLYQGELNTAKELGIPEFSDDEEATAPAAQTRLDWRK